MSRATETRGVTEALYLTSEAVAGLAEPGDYVDAVRDAYRQVGEGAAARPREKFFGRDPPGMLTSYAAILPESRAMGGYMYTAGFGAGDAWFLTPLFDAETGEPLAVIDGASMNPFKTGAAGAVGVDALARENAETVAVIGSGPQARGQLATTATVRSFTEGRVYSPTADHREAYADEMSDRLSFDVRAVESAGAAVADADVVITATNASEPVVAREELAAGAHVTAMGQYDPDKRELDHATIRDATYVPDLRARATQDAGSFLSALEAGVVGENHVHAELGEVVAGREPGRTSDDELTVFDSGGTGIETAAAARMLYDRAREADADLGTTIDVSPASDALTGRLPDE